MTEITGSRELADYAAIERTIAMLEERKSEIERKLHRFVEEITGQPVAAHGLIARMKPGRKSTDHRKAACDAAGLGQISGDELQDIIDEHTVQPEPRTKWAEVTKAAGIDVSGYCTQAPPKFVIERV